VSKIKPNSLKMLDPLIENSSGDISRIIFNDATKIVVGTVKKCGALNFKFLYTKNHK